NPRKRGPQDPHRTRLAQQGSGDRSHSPPGRSRTGRLPQDPRAAEGLARRSAHPVSIASASIRMTRLLLLPLLLTVGQLVAQLDPLILALRLQPGGRRPRRLGRGPFGPAGGHPVDGVDLDADGNRLAGPSLPDATIGWDIRIVAADGDLDVIVAGKRVMSGVD